MLRQPLLLLALLAAPAAAADWTAKADAPADPVKWPADLKVELPAPTSFFDPEVTFADQGGPFVALAAGDVGGTAAPRTVYDLRTGKAVAELKDVGKMEKRVLGPDGKFFAGVVGQFGKQTVSVFDVTTGKATAEFPVRGVEVLAFAGPDKVVYQGGFGDKDLHVIDAKTGKGVVAFPPGKGFRRCPPAFSPGGKYAAVAEGDDVTLFALADGSEAGKVSTKAERAKPGELPKFFHCEWLAFSPDGAFLAAISGAGHDPRVMAWSLADGKQVADLALEKNPAAGFYDGPKLEWLPDGSGWLLNGAAVYDRDSGRILWKVTEGGGFGRGLRRAVAANTVIYLDAKDNKNRVLKTTGIPADKLATIRTTVRGGGTALDAALPKLKEVDAGAAPEAEGALPGAAWAAAIDPAPAGPQAARRPIPLTVAPPEIDGVFVSSGDKPVAVFDLVKRENPFAQADSAPRRVEAVSLTTGKAAGKIDLPPGCKLVAISADGAQAVTVDQPDQRRVDVWSVADGKHVVGWLPFPKAAEKDRKLRFVGVSGDKLLTLNVAGQLVCWQLADAKPVYRASLPGLLAPTLTPGGKHLVGCAGGVVRFIDAATGAVKGDLEPKGLAPFEERGPTAVAIRPDGTEVAALFRKQGETAVTLARWDAKGKLLGETGISVPAFGTPDVQYAGADHLLIDHRHLYDVKRKALVWTYTLGGVGKFASRVPDGRVWYAAGAFGPGQASLVAVQLPEEPIEGYVKDVIEGPGTILKPGTKVGVRLNFTGSHAADAKKAAQESVYQTLKDYGLVPGEAGDLALEVTVTQKETGEKLEFRQMFGGLRNPRNDLTVKEIELECKATLSSLDGELWAPPAQKMRMRESFGIIHLPDKDTNLTDYLYKQVWDRVPGWAAGVGVPRYLAKTDAGVVSLPGHSTLTAGGVTTQKPGKR